MKKVFLFGLAVAAFVAANTASAQQEKAAPAKSENAIDRKSSKDVDKSFKQNKKGGHHHKHHKGAKPAPKQ